MPLGDIVRYPGFSTLSGGTRKGVVTDRPWQRDVEMKKGDKCPFCTRHFPGEQVTRDGRWRVFPNEKTPFAFHDLVIPMMCTEHPAAIKTVTPTDVTEVIKMGLEAAECHFGKDFEHTPIWLTTHRGYLAGQNVSHVHWHLLAPVGTPRRLHLNAEDLYDQSLVRSSSFLLAPWGHRAGELVVVQRTGVSCRHLHKPATKLCLEDLAEIVMFAVARIQERFARPDFMLHFALNYPGDWYVHIVPILNIQGTTEHAAAIYDTPWVMPWSHAETLAALR